MASGEALVGVHVVQEKKRNFWNFSSVALPKRLMVYLLGAVSTVEPVGLSQLARHPISCNNIRSRPGPSILTEMFF